MFGLAGLIPFYAELAAAFEAHGLAFDRKTTRLYVLGPVGAELAIIPNADHFTMAGQFELAAMVLPNFMERVGSKT